MSESQVEAAEVEVSEDSGEELEAEEGYEESSDEEGSGDDIQDAADEIEQAIEDGASQEEVQALVEKFNIKVNGREKEVELDWNNKEDIVRRLQLAEAAQEAMQSRSEMEKAFEREVNRLRENPWDVLAELGYDPDELAEARIAAQIEELQKSPEQRAQEQRDKELEDLRAKLRKQEEEREQLEMRQMQQKYEADLDREIEEAISATSSLPLSAGMKGRVASTMAWMMEEGGRPDIKASDVVPLIEREYQNEINEIFEKTPTEILEKLFSKKVTEKFRKDRLNKIPSKKNVVQTKRSDKEESPKQKQSLRDFLKNGLK